MTLDLDTIESTFHACRTASAFEGWALEHGQRLIDRVRELEAELRRWERLFFMNEASAFNGGERFYVSIACCPQSEHYGKFVVEWADDEGQLQQWPDIYETPLAALAAIEKHESDQQAKGGGAP